MKSGTAVPSEEARFQERLARALVQKLRIAYLVGAILFVLFAAFDHLIDETAIWRIGPIRLAVVLAFLGLLALLKRPDAAARVHRAYYWGLGAAAAAITGGSLPMPHGEVLAVGSMLLMITVVAALTATWRVAVRGYLIILAVFNVLAVALGASGFYVGAVDAFALAAASGGVAMAYVSEQLARRAFGLELELERMATRDSLTGARNRGSFLSVARQAVTAAEGRPLSLLLIDIDRFKAINDTYGHPAGDAVIRALAEIGRGTLRASDDLGRLGGEEFGLLLPDTTGEAARRIAERLRDAVARHEGKAGDHTLRFTISVGAAEWIPSEPLERLYSRADEALYAAKNSGRNRVCTAAAA